jgi:hypothetical protein
MLVVLEAELKECGMIGLPAPRLRKQDIRASGPKTSHASLMASSDGLLKPIALMSSSSRFSGPMVTGRKRFGEAQDA